MGYWDREQIREEVRRLTGRFSLSNPTNAQLNTRIHRYVRYKLPADIHLVEQETFYTLTTVSATGEYAFPDDFLSLTGPAYVGDSEMQVWLDPVVFYNGYSVDSDETDAKPADILIQKEQLILRPTPDAAYTVRIWGHKRPALLDDDGDELENDNWGELVAYGVAIDWLVSTRDFDAAERLRPHYEEVKQLVHRKTEETLGITRSTPIF